MAEIAPWLALVNFIGLILLWIKTNYMTKMLFLIGEHLGWNDEKGRPTI